MKVATTNVTEKFIFGRLVGRALGNSPRTVPATCRSPSRREACPTGVDTPPCKLSLRARASSGTFGLAEYANTGTIKVVVEKQSWFGLRQQNNLLAKSLEAQVSTSVKVAQPLFARVVLRNLTFPIKHSAFLKKRCEVRR
nr:hypothetical protein B3E4.120 [imported] - Neurospora crassa [Neurospora crassa]